ncbi:Endonuclease III-like protein 1 [Xylographa soralifera]|nr:Endonuclease III-like protein 1 [Xylographa soralifera]
MDLVRESRRGAVIRAIPELQENRLPRPSCRYSPRPWQEQWLYNELPMDHECYCDAIPLQLLTCCRTIYTEVNDLFYARNVFKLSWWNLPARETFQRLSAAALATITALQIDLGSIERKDRMIVTGEDIDRLFDIITTKCTTTKLNFTLVCDVLEQKHIGMVTQPFKRLTNLRSCCVCLAVLPDVALGKLAKKMVLGATNRVGHADAFPFMKLPKELRYQILEHTDLVVRWRDQMWSDDGLVILDGLDLADNKPSYCCRRCTSSHAFCCCPHLNSSFSESCGCFIFPNAFFRVSHRFATEAREVFFSQNRFIFTGPPDGTLSFLRSQPPDMLHLIRKIDFQMSTSNVINWPRPDDGGLRAWRIVVPFLAENLNLSNLSLSIDTGPAHDTYRNLFELDARRNDIRDFHQAVIEPLQEDKRFRQLRSFHVFWALFNEDETDAERAVKGPDYDSAREGKIPYSKRNPNFPHGVPDPSLAWENGMAV